MIGAVATSLSDRGAEFIANFEGYRAEPYWDINHYSIGYGTRAKSKSDGPITRAEALARLHRMVNRHFAPAVRALGVKLNVNQFDALVSFAFNLGPGVLDNGKPVAEAVQRGDFEAAGEAMQQYNRAGGQVLAGLTRRRQEERKLLLRKPPVNYSDAELRAFERLKNGTAQQKHDARAWLKEQAADLLRLGRRDGWQVHDRGRRYQGIRRRLRG